jgi:hypothetical protein
MRTQAGKLDVTIRFTVNQNQVRADVAISVVLPFPNQGMIHTAIRQWFPVHQKGNDLSQKCVQLLAMLAGLFPSIIALETA